DPELGVHQLAARPRYLLGHLRAEGACVEVERLRGLRHREVSRYRWIARGNELHRISLLRTGLGHHVDNTPAKLSLGAVHQVQLQPAGNARRECADDKDVVARMRK